VSISLDEVRHIAALARLGLDDAEAASIAAELSSILDHMEVLSRATTGGAASGADQERSMPLRRDAGPPIPLVLTPNDMAPDFRDGFFLVPRLATHEDVESTS
jgi:aspartyl-tRNA(Asn)/glutamyl-tRNA(Gln) amidotransferase subunit C